MSAVRLREVSALERVQLQRDKCDSAGTKFAVRFKEVSGLESVRSEFTVQSTLSKVDTLGTKATVRFREVSALERVPLQRYKCNSAGSGPNLLSGLESVRLERVDCIQHK